MNTPADLSPLLEAFFVQRLIAQRKASTHTINSYRDTFRLLLKFAERRLGAQRTNSPLKIWPPRSWQSFWIIWKPLAPMAHVPAIYGWLRSIRSSATRLWRRRSTPDSFSGCWPSLANGTPDLWSTSSPDRRSKPFFRW